MAIINLLRRVHTSKGGRAVLLLVILFLNAGFIFALKLTSSKINSAPNSFIRLFPPHPVMLESAGSIKYNSYYIAGASNSYIYLGNITAPRKILMINYKLTDTIPVWLEGDNLNKLKSCEVTVDTPYIYLKDGIGPNLLRATFSERKVKTFMYDSAYFVSSVPVSKNSFIIRTLSPSLNQYVLAKQTSNQPHIKFGNHLLKKQVDGLFCTSGMLHYDQQLNQLIYIYNFRNQILCIDTNLNLIREGKTIDTISQAKIKTAKLTSENKVVLSEPPLLVNRKSCVWKNWLFVNSNLLAKNEDAESFKSSSVIDVYDLKNITYKFSFYLPDIGKFKMRTFGVFNNKLVALYNNKIYTYNLSHNYFN